MEVLLILSVIVIISSIVSYLRFRGNRHDSSQRSVAPKIGARPSSKGYRHRSLVNLVNAYKFTLRGYSYDLYTKAVDRTFNAFGIDFSKEVESQILQMMGEAAVFDESNRLPALTPVVDLLDNETKRHLRIKAKFSDEEIERLTAKIVIVVGLAKGNMRMLGKCNVQEMLEDPSIIAAINKNSEEKIF